MSYGWFDRPTKVECKHRIGGDKPSRVVAIGKYEITIPDDGDADITYVVPGHRHQSDNPRDTFPNMMVADGEIRFPVEDLVPLMMSRLDPVDLAQALWANEEVRAHFIECAIERYSEANIGDADRRALIIGLQEAVSSAALDRAVNILGNLEYRYGQKWHFWQQIAQARRTIENIYPDAKDSVRIADPDHDDQFKVTGTNWKDAREHWREELRALIGPAKAIEARQGGDGEAGSVHESAVPNGDLPSTPSPNPHGGEHD